MKRFLILCFLLSPLLAFSQTNRLISSYATKSRPSSTDLFLMDTLTNYNKISYSQLSEALKTNPVLRGTVTVSNNAMLFFLDTGGTTTGGFTNGMFFGDGSQLTGIVTASTNAFANYATNAGSAVTAGLATNAMYAGYATNAGSAGLATNVAAGITVTNATLSGTFKRTHLPLYAVSNGTNYVVDFAQGSTFTIDATNNVNFVHATNFTAESSEAAVYMLANGGARTLTYNTDWQMVQTNAPTTVASGKCAVAALGIKLPGTNNSQTNVVCGVSSSQ